MKEVKEIIGIIKCQRSDKHTNDCVCCEGNHVHCVYVGEIDSDESIDINRLFNNYIRKDMEGERVKITIEVE